MTMMMPTTTVMTTMTIVQMSTCSFSIKSFGSGRSSHLGYYSIRRASFIRALSTHGLACVAN